MALLNRESPYYLGNDGIHYNPSIVTHLTIPLFDEKDCWYVEFFSAESLYYFKESIDNNILNKIRDGTIHLVLNNSHEAFHDVVTALYETIIIGLSIPPFNITLISESAIIDKEIRHVANKYQLPHCGAQWIRVLEYNAYIIEHSVLSTLEQKSYDKKFLNLNRRWRPHRPVFVALLKLHGLLDKGYVSFGRSDDNRTWETVWHDVTRLEPNLTNYQEEIFSIPELYLDETDLVTNRAVLTDSTDHYYLNAYFSVVSETDFYNDYGPGVLLSEKLFKPIIKRHPFIVLSTPYTLKALHDIGYQTFGNLIDESYDREEDDTKRMRMVLAETERLCNLSETELEHFLIEAKKICDYNYDNLKSKRVFITKLI